MSHEPEPDPDPRPGRDPDLSSDLETVAGASHVDARGARNVQVGENNVLIVQVYRSGSGQTWTDGVAAPPLTSVSGAIDSPYRGLNAFAERDSAFYFGRKPAAVQVLERMSRHLDGRGPLMVSGVSGAGKSSLVQAGVIPRFRAHGLASVAGSASWPCVVFTPTSAPLQELAVRVGAVAEVDVTRLYSGLLGDPEGFVLAARRAALSGDDGLADAAGGQRRVLLVVDQFEQIFTQCRSEDERQAFITALHAAATSTDDATSPAALVVLVVRADFEARCAEYEQLAAPVQDRYLVTPMTQVQLQLAITEPAKLAGSGVEDDLVTLLLHEISARASSQDGDGVARAGVLPLLSHALDQAWRGHVGSVLTLADYERSGGIEGALAASARRAYDRLTPGQRAAARQVFIRLTATSSDGVNTAARVARSELTQAKTAAEAGDIEAVLESFAAERLLILAHETVEISHEVLLSAWPLLRDEWLAETHADRIIRTRLRVTAGEWNTHERDSSYLYSGSLLNDATQAAARTESDPTRHPPLTPGEKDFLAASTRTQRRANRRQQYFTASLIALVLGLTSALGLAYRANHNTTRQRDIAISNQLISKSQISADTDPGASKQQTLIAWRLHHSSDSRYAMLNAAANPGLATFNSDGLVVSVAFSPDGKTLATASFVTVQLWDVATHRQIGTPLTSDVPVWSVAFSPDGKTLATGNNDNTARLWDVATHHQIGNPLTSNRGLGLVGSVAFSPDGKILATANTRDHTARLWDVATRRQIGNPLTGDVPVGSVAFSPDGKTLATAWEDHTVRLWDMATRRQIGNPLTGDAPVGSVAFSPDGKTLATGDRTARLWDVATHRQIGNPLTGDVPVGSVAFSPDGKILATGNNDNTARLWNVATHHQIGNPLTGNDRGASVAFSPDGELLATADVNAARLWDVATHHQIGNPFTSNDPVGSVAFSPDGKILATGSVDTAQLWDMATHRQIGNPLTGNRPVGPVITSVMPEAVAFSPDGKTLATAGVGNPLRLWDVATQRQIGTIVTGNSLDESLTSSMAFSPDGRTLATGTEDDNTVRLWDVATRRQIGTSLTSNAQVESVAFSPDGKTIADADDNGARLWDVATHRQIGNLLTSHNAFFSVAFSPDGKTLATGSNGDTARLWDVATHHQIGTPLTGNGLVESVAFSPDGKTLATGSDDHTARLWDVATHRQIGNPLTSADSVESVAFSPDGKTLATGSDDHTARLWDVGYLTDVFQHLCNQIGQSITRTIWTQSVQSGPAYQKVCS